MKIPKKETWKPIIGYEKEYSISNLGKVKRNSDYKSFKKGYLKKLFIAQRGYWCVSLYRNNERGKRFSIHSLIARAFIGECPEGKMINHKDGVKTNNKIKNLEYVTNAENMRHAKELGLLSRGENCPASKLNRRQVKHMRNLYKTNKYSNRDLAKIFGINKGVVNRILNYKAWAWLK